MSYNITNWNNKRIKNLKIPLSVIEDTVSSCDFSTEIILNPFSVKIIDEDFIKGSIDECGIVAVSSISVLGEFSGEIYEDLVKKILAESTGEIEVLTIWEGGDSIWRLTVKDGIVKEVEVEL